MTKCDRNRARLNKLAHLLGWGDLYVEQHKLPPEIVAAEIVSKSVEIDKSGASSISDAVIAS